MTDNEILDLAASAGITAVCCNHGGAYRDGVDTLKLFAEKAIEKFLEQSGQYVTNDASREAAIAQARAAEREACAQVCDEKSAKVLSMQMGNDPHDLPNVMLRHQSVAHLEDAAAIRARGAK